MSFMTGRVMLMILAVIYSAIAVSEGWDNAYDGRLYKLCPAGQAFYRIVSQHNDFTEDRLWDFRCRSTPVLSSGRVCQWYRHVNYHDGIMDFTCPSPGVVAGVTSEHNNHHEDRVWDFWCCRPASSSSCCFKNYASTGYINSFDGYMNWYTSKSIVGFFSYHDNYHEDRRWKVRTANIDC